MALPIVTHIERLPNLKVELSKLISEYQTVQDKLEDVTTHNNSTLVQRKFHLIKNDISSDELSLLPYTNSIIEEVFKLQKFNSVTYRSVLPNTCYNWHTDPGKYCVHIPLITSTGARFVYENRSFYMPADGSLYVVHNGISHTFANAGIEPRVHITFENL